MKARLLAIVMVLITIGVCYFFYTHLVAPRYGLVPNFLYVFNATPTTGDAPFVVTFDAKVPYFQRDNYILDFGDQQGASFGVSYKNGMNSMCATFSCTIHITHTYMIDGTYRATIRAIPPANCNGNCTFATPFLDFTKTVTVTVHGGVASAEIYPDPDIMKPPFKVGEFISFTFKASGHDFAVDYGDGGRIDTITINGTSIEHPNYKYQSPGTYTIKVTSEGKEVAHYQIEISADTNSGTIPLQNKNQATLKASPLTGIGPLDVTFSPAFMGMGDHWIEFGDGSRADVTCAEYKQDSDACIRMNTITHTYSAAGTYTASYKEDTATNVVGTVTISVQ